MRTKTVNLDEATKATLMRSRIEGNNLYLPGKLPRDEYQKVAKAIEAAGGKWNRKAECHVFPADVRKTLNIGEDTVSVVNVQQTWQTFFTPPELARDMVRIHASITIGQSVLEPSAGTGNLIQAIVDDVRCDIMAFEIHPELAEGLRSKFPNVAVVNGDFLKSAGTMKFDRVVMNPPFSRGDDVKHIMHALTFLRKGGRLVSICSGGPAAERKLKPFASNWIPVEAGTFAQSGTNIATVMLTIDT